MDEATEPIRRRGTVLLLFTIIVVGSVAGLYAAPPTYSIPDLEVRVAIIDSGIDITEELETRVVAQKSFVNTSLGYSETDNTTTDSNPRGVSHGTYIATIIASEAPDAALVNAKVVSSNDFATPAGVVEAIRWAVLEENCSVINLSLGMSPILNDTVGDAVKWAFHRGVSVVAAAGNNGQNGITGSSVESPAIYPEVIAVAAVDEWNVPYSFTATGPLIDRVMKPDISARGDFKDNGRTVLGTSFAAPIVAAGVSKIIAHCITSDYNWTPGMIKSAVMIGAYDLPYEEWIVGAGLFDYETSLLYLDFTHYKNGIPLVSSITPTSSPFSFERYFINQTARIHISIFSSSNDTFYLSYQGVAAKWLTGPSSIYVNQSGDFYVDLKVESSQSLDKLKASISFTSSGYPSMKLDLEFDAIVPLRVVAFDFSHTVWPIDSIYGQFRKLYYTLTKGGMAVDELRYPENLTLDVLSKYDAVFVFDPCTWTSPMISPYSYTPQQLAAYSDYFAKGGNLFLVGLSNSTIDHSEANNLYSQFNITLRNDHIPGITIIVDGVSSTELIKDMAPHPITDGIDAFDYSGCSLNYSGDSYEIAWADVKWQDEDGTIHSEKRSVLVGLENNNSGRLIATGSNYFLDNWALSGSYRSDQDLLFVIQTIHWLLHFIDA